MAASIAGMVGVVTRHLKQKLRVLRRWAVTTLSPLVGGAE